MKKLLAVLIDGLKFGVLVTGVSYGAFAAQTIIVDPAAEETATTVKTLEAAFAKLANSGDTILVRPGTYYMTQTLTNKVANLVFKSADAVTGRETEAEGVSIRRLPFTVREASAFCG